MTDALSLPEPDAVAALIQKRQTWKVLADPENPHTLDEATIRRGDQLVAAAIRAAAWAPFHYHRGANQLAEPWRVDWVPQTACRQIAGQLRDWFDDVKPSNKLPAMLSACGSLVLVSWLPQFLDSDGPGTPLDEKQRAVDEEHLAATAAFVQNLLLMLTAQGLGSYWSSGGQFREPGMRNRLRMDPQGRLLAAVFVDYQPQNPAVERLAGKLRDARDPAVAWLREVSLPNGD